MFEVVRDVGRYIRALARHWSGWLTSGVLIAGLQSYERLWNTTVPREWYAAFLALGFLIASFLAWREHAGRTDLRAVRTRLGQFLAAGAALKDRAAREPPWPASDRATEAEVADWRREVESYLMENHPPLDASFLVRFQNPATIPSGAGPPLWITINRFTETLRTLIAEVR